VENKKPVIFLARPSMGYIHEVLFIHLMQWITSGKYKWQVAPALRVSPHHRARNFLHREFMRQDESMHFDYVLWCDSDTIPPEDALEKFIVHNKDVVCGAVHTWRSFGPFFVAWNRVDEGFKVVDPKNWHGLQKVDIGTLSFCLMKADVLRAMPPGCFFWQETDEWHTEGHSEDTVFFSQLAEHGFEVYVDFETPCDHLKEVGLLQVAELLGRKVEK
jgi:hypothetical protein